MVIAENTRRSDEGAHCHRGDVASGPADRCRLGPGHHARLRRTLGLHLEPLHHAAGVDISPYRQRLGRRDQHLIERECECKREREFVRECERLGQPVGIGEPEPRALPEPVASPVPSGAPVTGGGGTAGFQDTGLAVLGGAAIVAGLGSIAYRRRTDNQAPITKHR